MNPTSLFRMRARWARLRLATGWLLSVYSPSLDESSRPRMESSVDFPQPEGPAMDTYSPGLISRWMPDKAWVSTSSVRKTFVIPSRRIKELLLVFMDFNSNEAAHTHRRPTCLTK